jgi:hypothetical protein
MPPEAPAHHAHQQAEQGVTHIGKKKSICTKIRSSNGSNGSNGSKAAMAVSSSEQQ